MADTDSVYNNPIRKRELVNSMNQLQAHYLDASKTLDKKAWDILAISSGTLGLVAAFQLRDFTPENPTYFILLLGLTVFVYLLQVREVLAVIVPFSWPIVPGVGNVTNPYNAWLEKYVATADESLSEDDYLDQLVADYVGHSDLQKPDEYTPGVLQLIEQQNKVKANHIKSAAKCLTLIVFMLISLGIIAYI